MRHHRDEFNSEVGPRPTLYRIFTQEHAAARAHDHAKRLSKSQMVDGTIMALYGDMLSRSASIHEIKDLFDAYQGGIILVDEIYKAEGNLPYLANLLKDIASAEKGPAVLLTGGPEKMAEFLRAYPGLERCFAHDLEGDLAQRAKPVKKRDFTKK